MSLLSLSSGSLLISGVLQKRKNSFIVRTILLDMPAFKALGKHPMSVSRTSSTLLPHSAWPDYVKNVGKVEKYIKGSPGMSSKPVLC